MGGMGGIFGEEGLGEGKGGKVRIGLEKYGRVEGGRACKGSRKGRFDWVLLKTTRMGELTHVLRISEELPFPWKFNWPVLPVYSPAKAMENAALPAIGRFGCCQGLWLLRAGHPKPQSRSNTILPPTNPL